MKLTIDLTKGASMNLSLRDILIALVADIDKEDYQKSRLKLIQRGIITKVGDSDMLTDKWAEDIRSLAKSDFITDERLSELATRVQDCFPKTKMRDMKGNETPFYYRCNKAEIRNKLRKFLERYGEYSDDEIVDATKRYVASFNGNYAGMRLAKYFIWKDDRRLDEDGRTKVENVSDLATFLENKDEDDVVRVPEDWMMQSKN